MSTSVRPHFLGESCRYAARGRHAASYVLFSFVVFLLSSLRAPAQQQTSAKPDFSKDPDLFPRFYRAYSPRTVPDPQLSNEPSVTRLLVAGKLRLSLASLSQAVKDNNLDLMAAGFSNSFAETDLLRAKGGGAPRGAPGVQIPSTLFSGAIGAGLGNAGGLGGFGSAGGISGSARAVTVRPSGTLDPTFLLNLSIDRSSSPLNTIRVSGTPTVTTSTTALQARYVQAFTTGTTISVTFSNQRQSSTQEFLLYNPAFVSSFQFSFTQPLLNGFGWAVNRRFMLVAKEGLQIAKEYYRQQVSTVLAQAQKTYWDLVAAQANVAVAERSLAVAQKLFDDNKMREKIGKVSRLDVIQSESEVAARQRDLVVAQMNLQTTEVTLKDLLTKQIDAALGSALIETTDVLPEPKDSDIPKLKDALATALSSRPELRQDEGNIAIQGVAIRYAKNLLKPSLSIFGLFGTSGLYGDQVIDGPGVSNPIVLPGGIGQAFRQVFNARYPEYAFGLSLTIPLLNRSGQADNIRGRLEERQAEIGMQQDRSQVTLEVRNALIALVQAKAQVEAAHQAVVLSAETSSAEEQRLLSGVSTPYDVIQRQRDLLAAQLAEVQARAMYAKALVELDRSTGVIDTK